MKVSQFILFRSKPALLGAIMSLIVVVIGFSAPLIAPYGPLEFSDKLLSPPSRDYYLGTDGHGRDLFSRIIMGSRITLLLAVIIISFSLIFGIVWGILAADEGGIIGTLINRAIDVVMAFPSILLALFVLAVVGTAGKTPLVLAISVTLAPRIARVIRGSTLPILKEEFILAEKALGANHLRILAIHLLPNLLTPIIVLASIYLPYVILLEAALSFLGLGAPPNVPTWGRIIADGKFYLQVAPGLTIFPGIAIIFTALAFNLLGDGLRDLFDPKSATRLHK